MKSLQSELIDLNNEILTLKTAQKKPANLKVFSFVRSGPRYEDATYLIQYKDSGEDFAPITFCTGAVLYGWNSANNTQRVFYRGSSVAEYYSSSREILSITYIG